MIIAESWLHKFGDYECLMLDFTKISLIRTFDLLKIKIH